MEKNKKELKSFSILILAIVALSLIRNIVGLCVSGIPQPTESFEGMTQDMVQTISIISFVLALVLFVPQIYLGIKGIMIANGATSGKTHIVWAIILIIISIIALIFELVTLINAFNIDTVMNALEPAIELALFAFYYVYACRVKNEK